jgi:NhaA family Na+:H+ antiporter
LLPHLSLFAVEHLLVLPLGALIALVWANTAPETYFPMSHAMTFFVNDIAMVVFFGLIMKEAVEATAHGGVLHSWRRIWLPVVAAVGATVVPALIYVWFVEAVDEPMLVMGWPVTFAIDLAFSYFVARLIFGRHPAVPFLVVVGIAANAFGFTMLALFAPMRDVHLGIGAALLAAALAAGVALRRARVKSFWPYVLLGGVLSWLALFSVGVHPALALVPILPFLPHAARDPGFFVDANPGARDTLSRFEIVARYPAQAALFLFGLVNAGIPFGALESGTFGVAVATVIGRPVGLLLGTGVGLAIGLHLPAGLGWRDLVVLGFATAVAFSVGLFFSTALFPPGVLLRETQMGVLLSLAGALLAIAAAALLKAGRFGRHPSIVR